MNRYDKLLLLLLLFFFFFEKDMRDYLVEREREREREYGELRNSYLCVNH